MAVKFLIVASGYNCSPLVSKCISSVIGQTFQSFDAVFISDGSTDDTGKVCQNISVSLGGNRIFTEWHDENLGAAKRRYDAIRKYSNSPDTVVVLLGLDDELLPNALETIAKHYEAGKWMTYGNWVNQDGVGLPEDFELEFDEATHASRDYRKVRYRSTAPNTFKRFLFDHIPEEEFKVDGKWIKATTESHLMFSCLEMSGKDRIGVIKERIYLYNQGRVDNARKRFGDNYQDNIYKAVIVRPKKNLLTFPK